MSGARHNAMMNWRRRRGSGSAIWDWESDAATGAASRGRASADVVRRRRLGAGLALVLLVAVGAVILAGGPGSHGRAQARARVRPPILVAPDRFDRAIDRVLAGSPLITEGGRRRREIALTFDDGPGPYTGHLLRVLTGLRVPATFFAIGNMERYFSASTVAEQRAGDVVGDHTQSHPFLARLSRADQRREIFAQAQRLHGLGLAFPRLFRPPYGSFDQSTLAQLRRFHMLMVLWSVDTQDYRQPGVATIVSRVLAGAHPGAIVLLHDGGGTRLQTIQALPIIVRRLRARHYHLVTVPQLLLNDPPPPGQAVPPRLTGG